MLQQPVIYVDILFLTNLTINYIILFAVGKSARSATRQFRLILASALGALYAVVLFYPHMMFLFHAFFKLVFSILLVLIAFRFESPKRLFKNVVYFYIISFAFAGAASFANQYFTTIKVNNGVVYFESSIWILILSCIAAYFLITFFLKLTTTRYQKEKIIKDLLVTLNGRYVTIKGIVDTGNSLCDPITKKPVVIAELSQVLPLFDETELNFFRTDTIEGDAQMNIPIKLIPYQALGVRSMLKCFVPDSAVVLGEQQTKTDLIIAVKNEKLSQNGEFHAILNPLMLS